MNSLILGSGKIGLDLYYKCKQKKIFENIIIFNRNKNSAGSLFCKKNKISCSHHGVYGVLNELKKRKKNIIFDATSAKSSYVNFNLLKNLLKKNYYINLTPSKIGEYTIPYFNSKKINKKINLITCGGQSSLPLILQLANYFKKRLLYVELVSSISSLSAGEATRNNINEYISNTENAIYKIAKIKKCKVIINLNPSNPPVNMMNSLFFQIRNNLNNRDIKMTKKIVNLVNIEIKRYIPGFNAKFFFTPKNNIFRVTIRVVGQGDYLPSYAGNLDIITSAAAFIGNKIYEKNYN